jgi:hypothetical protein
MISRIEEQDFKGSCHQLPTQPVVEIHVLAFSQTDLAHDESSGVLE